jgi:hypothetical protein
MGVALPSTWVFDVDGCVIDSLSGSSVRPLAAELFTFLREHGVAIVLWSAGGEEYALARAREVGVEALVDSCHAKQGRDRDGRRTIDHLGVVAETTTFVDDRDDEIPEALRSVIVSPYLAPDPHDRGLERAFELARRDFA